MIRLVILIVVVAAAAAFFLGYRWGNGRIVNRGERPVATVGRDAAPVDASKARQAGAEVGEKVAQAANAAGEMITDGQLTAKIKSKMALDDLVQARTIDVDSRDGVVTVGGRVRSEAERRRALELARDTAGVKSVVDRLVVEAR